MPKQEAPLHQLIQFLPAGTYDAVVHYLVAYKIHLTITRQRKTILGDYQHRTRIHHHRISINGNLNPYAFLITLLHEIAHLLAFEQYGHTIQAHGREWKTIYAGLLKQFLESRLFPPDIETELLRSMKNPAASSCAEEGLIRILRQYNRQDNGFHLVEEIPDNAFFQLEDGRIFKKGKKLRKRFQCQEVSTGRMYLFNPVYEVEKI